MLCDSSSRAGKRYQLTVLVEMVAYILIVFGVTTYVHRHHPEGAELYVLAAFPCVPILAVLFAVGIYLRDERDEYQRDLTVKSMLWGTAGVLAMTAFFGFLRSYQWKGSEPPFAEFVVFWLLVALAKLFYTVTNRADSHE